MSFRRRDVFLAIRGVDQSGRAFRSVDRRIENLITKQMRLAGVTRKIAKQQIADNIRVLEGMDNLNRASYRLMFAGAAFLMFGAAVAYGIGKIIGASSMGELYVEDFRRAIEKLMTSVSEAILEEWGPAIEDFIDWLDKLAGNETFNMIIGKTAIPLMLTITVLGVALLMGAVLTKLTALLISGLIAVGWWGAAIKVEALATGGLSMVMPLTITFLVAIALSFIGKTLQEQIDKWYQKELEDVFGPAETKKEKEFRKWKPKQPSGGGAWDWLMDIFGFQSGTTRITRTGPIIAHEGEWLFNPQLPISSPPQMMGRGATGPIEIIVNQYIDSVGIEADEDRLADKTAERIGDKLIEVLG